MKYLCENIQGCVLGYTQSDEITLVLVDYKTFSTDAWFGYNVQKCTSIAASMATMEFNRRFEKHVSAFIYGWEHLYGEEEMENRKEYEAALLAAVKKGAMFDARIFNITKEEVTNCVYWRQLDASRNSVQMVGQANFSHNELQNKNCSQIQDMLMLQKGINWNNLPTYQKRESCCIKEEYVSEMKPGQTKDEIFEMTTRSRWVIDKDIPIFKGDGRKYIDSLVYVGE